MKKTKNKCFYIKEAAKITGISEQLIRKWEKRYQIIQPKRLDNGYRVYTNENLLTLKELKALREQGKTMTEAIQSVLEKQQEKKIESKLEKVTKSQYVMKLIEAGTVYDEEKQMLLLKQAHHEYGLDLFLRNTVQPFLEEVGHLWKARKWDESQETVSSLVVKDFLTGISRNFNHDIEAPHALGICLPHELHEIPLQVLLLQLKIRGWRTTRIAGSPKFSAIEELILHFQPRIVMFSATTVIPYQRDEQLLQLLDDIATRYPSISFFIGGQGTWNYTKIVKPVTMKVAYTVNDIIDKTKRTTP